MEQVAAAEQKSNQQLSSGQAWYRNVYLKSDHWRKLRSAKFATQKFCQTCGFKRHLDVHHASYANLWHESPTELIVLCRACHKREHSNLSDSQKIRIARQLMQRAESARQMEIPVSRPPRKQRRPTPAFIEYSYHCLRMIRSGIATETETAFVRSNHALICRLPV